MADLPITLQPEAWRCLVVGGGPVATRRARWLAQGGAHVVVVAPNVADELASLAHELHRRAYRSDDLAGVRLVVAATDDPAVNDAVTRDAAQRGILCNRPDAPEKGDFTVPALGRAGPVTVAVATGAASPAAAGAIRDELLARLDPAWPRLLDIARPYRQALIARGGRDHRLRRLTDATAMDILKARGEQALRDHLDSVTREPDG